MTHLERRPGPGAIASITGFTAGLLFYLMLLAPWLLAASNVNTLCAPMPGCRSAATADFVARALVALGPAILLGAALSRMLHWFGRRLRPRASDKVTGARMATPWGALLALPLAIGGGIALVWAEAIWSQG